MDTTYNRDSAPNIDSLCENQLDLPASTQMNVDGNPEYLEKMDHAATELELDLIAAFDLF